MTSNKGKVALKGDRNDLISVTELLLNYCRLRLKNNHNKAWVRSWAAGLQGTNLAGSQSGTWIRSLPIRSPALYLLGPRRPLKVTFDATVMHSRKNVLAWKDNSQASKAHVYSILFLYCLLVAIDLWCIVKWEFLFSFFLVIAPSFPPPEPPSCPS